MNLTQILMTIAPSTGLPAEKGTEIVRQIVPKESESTYRIAELLMGLVTDFVNFIGLGDHPWVITTLYSIVVAGIAILIGWALQFIVVAAVKIGSRKIHNSIFQNLVLAHFFTKATRIIPPIVFLVLIQFTFTMHDTLSIWLTRITLMIIVIYFGIASNVLVDVIWIHLDESENKRHLPLKGIAQLTKGIVWIVCSIIIIAIFVNKSPMSLLAGLGAFAAVLMLVFKDSILGVVAGVQLSENDSLHVGDWIKVDSAGANGTVTEVTLTSVKVENWDKTTTTLPPYSLISGSFTNYRTMQASGTRRIARTYFIDADSIYEITPEELERIRKIQFMDEYITRKLELMQGDTLKPQEWMPNGTLETNLGLFRAYMESYLHANKDISQDDTCFVTSLQQTYYGVPLQIYCFTNTSSWIPYEAIQAEVFEHLAIMLSKFGLYTLESVSGRDSILEGVLEYGRNPEEFFGLPQPFLNPRPTATLRKAPDYKPLTPPSNTAPTSQTPQSSASPTDSPTSPPAK